MTVGGNQGISLTRSRAGDGPAMRRLARAAYAVYVDRMGREPAPMTADYETIAAAGNALLAWRDGDLIGMLVAEMEEQTLLISNVAISPAVQGSGFGSMLLAEAERMAREARADEVRLYTNEAMVGNLTFYRRRGYLETHRATEDGYRRVFFSKRIHLAP